MRYTGTSRLRSNKAKNGDITLDQSRYCSHVVERYLRGKKYDSNRKRDTPLPPSIKLSKTWSTEKKGIEKFDELDYRACIGSLIYLATGTRYDIMFAVTKLAKFVRDPGVKHYAALVWLLQYIKANINQTLKSWMMKTWSS